MNELRTDGEVQARYVSLTGVKVDASWRSQISATSRNE
jgi:hypothetical protein